MKKLLPIGTVVLLKEGKKRLMITGFYVKMQGQNDYYDYCGCMYPEGFIESDKSFMFNNDQIKKICYMGLSDQEDKDFKKWLEKEINKVK